MPYMESGSDPDGDYLRKLGPWDIPAHQVDRQAPFDSKSNYISPTSSNSPISLDQGASSGREDTVGVYSLTECKQQLALRDILSALELMAPGGSDNFQNFCGADTAQEFVQHGYNFSK